MNLSLSGTPSMKKYCVISAAKSGIFSPTHKLAVDGIQQPKQSTDIKSQRERNTAEHVVSDLPDKRSITGCGCVRAGKVVDKCKGEVNGLSNLEIDKNDLETCFYRCKHCQGTYEVKIGQIDPFSAISIFSEGTFLFPEGIPVVEAPSKVTNCREMKNFGES